MGEKIKKAKKVNLYKIHSLLYKDADKIEQMVNSQGFVAYGIYWSIIEQLYIDENHKIEKDLLLARYKPDYSIFLLEAILENFGLFDFKDNYIYSQLLTEELEKKETASAKRKETIRLKKEQKAENIFASEANIEQQIEIEQKDNEIKQKTDIIEQLKLELEQKDFVINKLEEVVASQSKTIEELLQLKEVVKGLQEQINGKNIEKIDTNLDADSDFSLLLQDGSYYNISNDLIREWSLIYKNVDVEQELEYMDTWCKSNPQRRKTRKYILRFINTWLTSSNQKSIKENRLLNANEERQRRQVESNFGTDDNIPRPNTWVINVD